MGEWADYAFTECATHARSALSLKLIEGMLKQMGDTGSDLLNKYFPSDLTDAS